MVGLKSCAVTIEARGERLLFDCLFGRWFIIKGDDVDREF